MSLIIGHFGEDLSSQPHDWCRNLIFLTVIWLVPVNTI